ncbi:serine hydrolase [Methanosphaerula palustris]|uniref:Beta-lactamase n=1 Tax=Methanosphaerula palustris (strain ATCC BAA-1556 / DSM 19958 / E1-9c) TaxID=521011 RepID=B8GF94_METPE|nr:serine hydrolase [Methanosphaerula palustris]ACL17900.1 beta-lactamase [Methanosphaerula palustris E1-9c]
MPSGQPVAIQNTNLSTGSNGTQEIATIIPQFDAYAEQTFRRSGVPGMAVAVVQNDTVIYLRCFGVKNITTQEPVTPDTRFQLASISKSFTSASIASMVGNGELSWDDKVATINPDFQLADLWVTEHVTFRDLLSQRTGLPQYGSDELQSAFAYNRSEILNRLRYLTLTGEFRSSYAYSNIGITSAAEAAAVRAGMPWEDLVAERVFVPAGMNNTSARFDDFALAGDHADTYPMTNGTAVAGPLMNDEVNSPAGGVSSTINDMTRYARLQLNEGSIDGKQVIAAEALHETHKPQNIMNSSNTSIMAYALGWDFIAENGRVRVEHGGDLSSGVSTYITLYPEEKMGIVILTNGFPEGYTLKTAVTKGWDDLYFSGTVKKDWYNETEALINSALEPGASALNPYTQASPAPADAEPARPLVTYTGTYSQDYYGTLRVDTNETGLLVYPGHSTDPMFLVPYDRDTFLNQETNTVVNFTVGNAGTVTSAWFAPFDLPGRNGTFVRISL